MSILARRLQSKKLTPAGPGIALQNAPDLQFINGHLVPYEDNRQNYIVKGYNVNDVIYSIVQLITDKARVARWGIYTVSDETAYKQFRFLQQKKEMSAKDYIKIVDLQHKAMKPSANPGKWGDLIEYPNEDEGFGDFAANGIAYRLLTGNDFTWGVPLTAGANKGVPYELNWLPAQYIDIIASREFPVRALGYYLSVWPDIKFTRDQIVHQKDFNPNWDINGNQLYGMSRLRAGLMRLQKNNSLTRAEASTFKNEGVKGILYMDNKVGAADGDEVLKEINKLKQTLKSEWEGEKNRGKIGTSGYTMGYIPIGMTSEDMQLIESAKVDLRYFCNLFGGVPSQLLNDPDNKIYSNMKEGEKALTSRCVLPHMTSKRDSLNRKASTEWGLRKGDIIDFDMTCYPELQADVSETVAWTNGLIVQIPDEQRELAGLAATGLPELKQPWVKQGTGYIPLTDFQANAVDNALNNDPTGNNSGATGN